MKTSKMPALLALCATCSLAPVAAPVAAPIAAPVARGSVAPSYTDKGQGFALWLPARPEPGTRKATVPGVGAVTVRYVALKTPDVVYVVVPTPIPKGASTADKKAVLAGIEEGFRASSGGKVLSSKSIKLGRYPGREVVITMGAGAGAATMRGRFFVATGRSYQVMAITPANKKGRAKPQIQKVLDSFRILN